MYTLSVIPFLYTLRIVNQIIVTDAVLRTAESSHDF